MKNILIIGTNHYSAMGGIEKYMCNIMNNIPAKYFFLQTTTGLNSLEGIEIENLVSEKKCLLPYKVKIPFISIPFFWMRMRRAVKSFNVKFDKVIINQSNFLMPKNILKNSIFVMHFNGNKYFKKSTFRKLFEVITFRKNDIELVDKIVTFTEFDKEQIPKTLHGKVVCQPVVSEMERLEKKLPSKVNKIGWIGRYDNQQKDINFYSELSNACLNYTFTCVGGGNDTPHGKVTDLGPMNSNGIKNYLDSIDVLVMTSNHEGFPFVAAEAIARGVPVILPNTFPSAKYMTQKYKCGILVNKNFTEYKSAFENIISYVSINDFKKYNSENTFENFILNWKVIIT